MFTQATLRFGVIVLGCAALMAALGGCPRNIAPTVSFTAPSNGSTGVPLGGNLSVTFSETMDATTITTSTFILDVGTATVSGTVTYAGLTAIFNPESPLAPMTAHTATITTGAADLAGKGLTSNYVWTFTTGAALDTTAPTVSSTAPADGAIGVPLGSNLTATFSEAMDSATITNSTFTLDKGAVAVLGTVTYAGVSAIFNPASAFAPNTVYTATITSRVTDLSGNALASDYVWTFTTGAALDTTVPAVSFTVPTDSAIDVPFGSNLTATFSEAMDPATLTPTTFTLDDGVALVPGTVIYVGVTAILNPASALASNTAYTATITVGAADLSGNALASDYLWSFTTGAALDITAPEVSSTAPADGTTGMLLGGNLVATFSEAMDPLTITTATFTLARRGTTLVSGTVTYAGVTAVFNPTSALASNTVYTATITVGAKDLAGNALASHYVWTFTTGIATTQAAVDLGAASTFAVCQATRSPTPVFVALPEISA